MVFKNHFPYYYIALRGNNLSNTAQEMKKTDRCVNAYINFHDNVSESITMNIIMISIKKCKNNKKINERNYNICLAITYHDFFVVTFCQCSREFFFSELNKNNDDERDLKHLPHFR
jgi:hypothetical protein